jgi:hypothetical protein
MPLRGMPRPAARPWPGPGGSCSERNEGEVSVPVEARRPSELATYRSRVLLLAGRRALDGDGDDGLAPEDDEAERALLLCRRRCAAVRLLLLVLRSARVQRRGQHSMLSTRRRAQSKPSMKRGPLKDHAVTADPLEVADR